jgi:hypothetical protein
MPVAMGMYLPISLMLPTGIGALIGYRWDKGAERSARVAFLKRSGVLLATGMIVGESLFGLVSAGLIGALGDAPLAVVGDEFAGPGQIVALVATVAAVGYAYAWTRREAAKMLK